MPHIRYCLLLLFLLSLLPVHATPDGSSPNPRSAPASAAASPSAPPSAAYDPAATPPAAPATTSAASAPASALPAAAPDPVSAPAQEKETLHDRADFRHRLDLSVFEGFASEAPGVKSVKLIVDRKPVDPTGPARVYFLNSRVYDLHITFLRQNRLVSKDQARTIQLETWRSENRRFIFAQLARYEEPGQAARFVVEMFDEDRASARLIAELVGLVRDRVSFGPIAFKPNSLEQESRRRDLELAGIPVLSNDALNQSRLFQVVHAGRPAVGRLRVITETDPAVVENMVFNRNDIVLLQTIPNDITRVAGVITTRPTTPLSHVSLRARTWDIPNVMLREALTIAYKEGLEDAWVRLEVGADGRPTLRRATDQEIKEAEAARAASMPTYRIPRADLTYGELVELYDLRVGDVIRFGTKSANLGELSSLTRELPWQDLQPVLAEVRGDWLAKALGPLPKKPQKLNDRKRARAYMAKMNVPAGFGVPFAAYQAFLELPANKHIRAAIEATLNDPKFHEDAVYRKQRLEALQETIRGGTFPPDWGTRILDRIHARHADRRLFVRSSTNCEDLEGFNGAGLYETVGNIEGDQAVLEAIKRVWASIWNFKAYEARMDAGIDHRAVYPAVLVQDAVKPFAAGVLITKDVLDREGGYRFYLNANPGFGENTVNAGRGAPEQVYGDPATGEIKRISLSERGGDLLTDVEVQQLIFFSAVVERHFGRLAGNRFPYPQDIEWLVVGGQVSLVQTRPYLEPKGR